MMNFFSFDDRLGIAIPDLTEEWDQYCHATQTTILFHWEKIRGTIPDRIIEIEQEINLKQAQLSDENSFSRSCLLNSEIAELASIINDLWLWYRSNQSVSVKLHQ